MWQVNSSSSQKEYPLDFGVCSKCPDGRKLLQCPRQSDPPSSVTGLLWQLEGLPLCFCNLQENGTFYVSYSQHLIE